MKANRKFLKNDEEAVSPVIAVILMVAITVVLAATVYVWVSGFGASNSQPAKSIALTGDGALNTPASNNDQKTYMVASASPGLKWADLTVKLGGAPAAYADVVDLTANTDSWCVLNTAGTDCDASAAAANLVDAGDKIRIEDASLAGQQLLFLDAASNSIIYTLTVQ